MRKQHIVFPVLCVMSLLWMTATPLPAPVEGQGFEEVYLSDDGAGSGAAYAFDTPKDAKTITPAQQDVTPKKSKWNPFTWFKKSKTPQQKQQDMLTSVQVRIQSLEELDTHLPPCLAVYTKTSQVLANETIVLVDRIEELMRHKVKAHRLKEDGIRQYLKQQLKRLKQYAAKWRYQRGLKEAFKKSFASDRQLEVLENSQRDAKLFLQNLRAHKGALEAAEKEGTLLPKVEYKACKADLKASKKLISRTKEGARKAKQLLQSQITVLQKQVESMRSAVHKAWQKDRQQELEALKKTLANAGTYFLCVGNLLSLTGGFLSFTGSKAPLVVGSYLSGAGVCCSSAGVCFTTTGKYLSAMGSDGKKKKNTGSQRNQPGAGKKVTLSLSVSD